MSLNIEQTKNIIPRSENLLELIHVKVAESCH
jgi:hypothetical protein